MVIKVYVLLILETLQTIQVSLFLKKMRILLQQQLFHLCLLLDFPLHALLNLLHHLALLFILQYFVCHAIIRKRGIIIMSFGGSVTAIAVVEETTSVHETVLSVSRGLRLVAGVSIRLECNVLLFHCRCITTFIATVILYRLKVCILSIVN